MSSINSISSSTSLYPADTQISRKQRTQDFKALQTALQSGNLSAAQEAFASFQQSQPNNSSGITANGAASTSGQNSQASNAFQSLQSALTAGNLSGAQQAFATLQRNLEGAAASKSGRRHNHGSSMNAVTQTDNSTSGNTTAESLISALDVQA
jgi:hypothetical protein